MARSGHGARGSSPGRKRPEPAVRNPAEIRELESRVWDLTRNLVHPAFLYVVLQVAFWCALDRNPGFRGAALSFWEHAGIHAIQFLGAWGVFYGTLLRDMRMQTRVVTVVLWLAVLGTAAAWLWPDPESLRATPAFRTLLVIQLAAGFSGWAFTMATWFRAKARHEAEGAGD